MRQATTRMTQFVYRPKRWRQGKHLVAKTYSGRYKLTGDVNETYVALGVGDKQVAQEKLRRIVGEVERERAGLIAPKLQRNAAALPLRDHITAYCASRRGMRCDEKYVRELERKLVLLEAECGWERACNVTAESFEAWRAKQSKLPKTLNEYFNAISGLMNWLEQRIGPNPLRFVRRIQTGVVPQRIRRAYTPEELQRLVDVSGERGFLYLFAARTGLRRAELQQIQWKDLRLDAPQPFVSVRASTAKNHKPAEIPFSRDLATALSRSRPAGASALALVFSRLMPRMNRFRADLKAAGIAYIDDTGAYADFHSFRKTFDTELQKASVPPRAIMELMRVSDMRLISKTYMDARMLPLAESIGKLPPITLRAANSPTYSLGIVTPSPSPSAPVNANDQPPKLLTAGDKTFSPSESASVPSSPEEADGARCRVRTCDFLRVKQALYH